MRKYLIFCFFFCGACAAGNKVMTTENFSEIEIGITESELKKIAGEPYAIKKISGEEKEFEYIERIVVNDRTMQIRHYFFTIKNGVVTSKRTVDGEKEKPLLERNAYDLQTSFQDEF